MQRALLVIGTILVVTGLLWPWLQKLGFGHLPGDIVIQRENFRFYFPLSSTIIISILLSLIFWLLRK